MSQNRIRGPLVTLAAVVALGGGIWLVNESQRTEPVAASPAPPAGVTAPAPSPASAPASPQFPPTADYAGEIATPKGVITVDIAVDGDKAVAYACRAGSFESWLRGGVIDGRLDLVSADRSSRLVGGLTGGDVAGTLSVGTTSWDFTADRLAAPEVSDARIGADDVG